MTSNRCEVSLVFPILVTSHPTIAHDSGGTIVEHGVEATRERLQRRPETQLALTNVEQQNRLFATIGLDPNTNYAHNNGHDHKGKFQYRQLEKKKYLPEIDQEWRDRLHRRFFDGKSIGHDHEAKMLPVKPGSPAAEAQRVYQETISLLGEIRREMLDRDAYFYTAEVAKLMSSSEREVSPSDVTALAGWGDLLGVRDHGRTLFPGFQFDMNGLPIGEVYRVNRRFDGDPAWDVLAWWHLPLIALDGKRLMQTIHSEEGRRFFEIQFERIPE